ncbi:MAG TPA: endospore germination permease [Epulopiscium sp.]|nr:endospore germination permease [Candidatus Epulonipiscium sp.]
MFSKNDKVSVRQVEILLILDLFSVSILSFPRMAAEIANQDAWIAVIGATLLAFIYGYTITSIVKRFPEDTFVEFSSKVLSKSVGIFLSLLFSIKLSITMAMELRIFGELVKQVLLPRTPIEIIMASMLLTCAYLVRKGYECNARLGEILVFIIFIPLIVILLFVLPDTDFSNLKPIFTTPFPRLLKGSYFLSFIYTPIELILLVGPLVNDLKKARRVSFIAITFTGIINVILTIITVSVLGSVGTKQQIWPVMTLMQIIEIPGAFVERQDALMMIFWILIVFSFISTLMYFISFILTRILKAEEHKFLVLPLVPIIYLISLIPDNIVEAFNWIEFLRKYIRILFLLPIPLLLLIVAKIRKLGESIEEK